MNFLDGRLLLDGWIIVSSILYPILFAAFFIFLAKNFSLIKKRFLEVDRKTWITLFFITVFSFLLRYSVAPDGIAFSSGAWEWINTGLRLSQTGLLTRCDAGTMNDCIQVNPISHPAGYVYYLAVIFLVFGKSLEAAGFIQGVFASLTPLMVFFAVHEMRKKKTEAILSAAFISAMPLHVIQSFNPGIEGGIFSVFFEALALFAFFFALNEKTINSKYFAVLALAMALSFRFQNIILYLLFFLFYLQQKNRPYLKSLYKDLVKNKRIAVFGTIVALIPFFMAIKYWFIGGLLIKLFSIQYLFNNMTACKEVLVIYFMPYIALFVVFAIAATLKKETRLKTSVFIMWFLGFLVLYGSFSNAFNFRYILSFVLPISIVSGIGFSVFINRLSPKGALKICLIISVAILLTSVPIAYEKRIIVNSPVSDLISIIESTGSESSILIPNMNTVWAILFYQPERETVGFFNYNDLEFDNVYLIATLYCDYPPYTKPCTVIEKHATPISETEIFRLYKMDKSLKNNEEIRNEIEELRSL